MKYQSITGKEWILSKYNENLSLEISQKLGIDNFLSKLLSIRKITPENCQSYLSPKIKEFMPNPSVLKDMDLAVDTLIKAIKENKRICILGDYDVDGASSTAIIVNFLKNIYSNFFIYIPDRQVDGYGPSVNSLKNIIEKKGEFLITVDCGTSSFEALEYANQNNIDVLVIDHHQAEIKLPKCKALVNPNQLDDKSNLGYLCAAGVSFLFIVALNRSLRESPDLYDYLDLVALGTICDVVPLIDLNRAFVYQGIQILKKRKNLGIKTLIDVADIKESPNTYHIGFLLGPRINAGGRIGQSDLGANLLTSEDPKKSYEIATTLDSLNKKRKTIEEDILNEAYLLAEKENSNEIILVANKFWHEGLIGIIASRIKERFLKPTIVISSTNNIAKGSCRSIFGFDIGLAILAAKQNGIVIKGGGHKMAAGFSIEENKISDLKSFLISKFKSSKPNFVQNNFIEIDGILSANAVNEKKVINKIALK
ncbi:MAG: single-stranded-DNA-specific exonuclease RecJ, partial [Proteobacteria bacterium]|nr:single-stranded-DNA-specific exonuclease RecJ [Candidatus Fonsibacter sp. PEL4]